MSRLTKSQVELVKGLARQFGVESVRLFGSRARGSAGPASDVDLLVRFEKPVGLVHVISFQQAIEERLNLKVDVVQEGGLSPHLRDTILNEAVSL